MQRQKQQIALMAVALLWISACGGIQIKQAAVSGLQAAHAAASQAQDTEISVWEAGLAPADYTEADRKAFHAGLSAFFGAELAVSQALQAWNPDEAAPPSVGAALDALLEADRVLARLAPGSRLSQSLAYVRVAVNRLRDLQRTLTEN